MDAKNPQSAQEVTVLRMKRGIFQLQSRSANHPTIHSVTATKTYSLTVIIRYDFEPCDISPAWRGSSEHLPGLPPPHHLSTSSPLAAVQHPHPCHHPLHSDHDCLNLQPHAAAAGF